MMKEYQSEKQTVRDHTINPASLCCENRSPSACTRACACRTSRDRLRFRIGAVVMLIGSAFVHATLPPHTSHAEALEMRIRSDIPENGGRAAILRNSPRCEPSPASHPTDSQWQPVGRVGNGNDPRLRGEEHRAEQVLSLLDPDRARAWLASFITAPPMNCKVYRREEWVDAIVTAVQRNDIPLCKEILGLTACIIAIESGFREDPPAVDTASGKSMRALLDRAEHELHRKAGSLLSIPPLPELYQSYRNRYYPMLLACKTERQIERVADQLARELTADSEQLPDFMRKIVHRGIDRLSGVVSTKGSMQLSFHRARTALRDRGESITDEELVEYMYSLEGGVDVGVAALRPMFIQYAARYSEPASLTWLFFVGMDYHYGPFSSRNMMEQIRIRDLSGVSIPLDGDLLMYDEHGAPLDFDSQTLQAAMKVLPGVPRDRIFEAFKHEKGRLYIYTDVHRAIAVKHQKRFGKTPFAVIGDLWMGKEAAIKHGALWKTRTYLNKLDRFLNSLPWDSRP